jgi:hypothetical protein
MIVFNLSTILYSFVSRQSLRTPSPQHTTPPTTATLAYSSLAVAPRSPGASYFAFAPILAHYCGQRAPPRMTADIFKFSTMDAITYPAPWVVVRLLFCFPVLLIITLRYSVCPPEGPTNLGLMLHPWAKSWSCQ